MQKEVISNFSTSELIELAVKNHPAAITALVERHKGMVFNLAFRILGNYHDAEEAAQDTFLKAFRALQRFRSDSKFSTWLFRICYNTCLTVKRKKFLETQELNGCVDYYQQVEFQPHEAEQNENIELVNRAMCSLQAEEAAIITLFYVDDLSTAEIAEITGISEVNVRVKLHRSRKHIKEKITEMAKQNVVKYQIL